MTIVSGIELTPEEEAAASKYGLPSSDGFMLRWFKNGNLHSYDDVPACRSADGYTKSWYKDGLVHRKLGPAHIDNIGNLYYLNGINITEKTWKSAMLEGTLPKQLSAGICEWRLEKNGLLHSRTELADGKDYYLYGVRLSYDEWVSLQNKTIRQSMNGFEVCDPDGTISNLDGPAIFKDDGVRHFAISNILCSEKELKNAKAHGLSYASGWVKRGSKVLHGGDLPARMDGRGISEYYSDGLLHRMGGPARIGSEVEEYYLWGIKLEKSVYDRYMAHLDKVEIYPISSLLASGGRDGGFGVRSKKDGRFCSVDNLPSRVRDYGGGVHCKEYYNENNILHREDGPAYEHIDQNGKVTTKEYWFEGRAYSQDVWAEKVAAKYTYDFGDGSGPVPAHRHKNGGGWVANTAAVDDSVYVGPQATVYGKAIVRGKVDITTKSKISGNSYLDGNILVRRNSIIGGRTTIKGKSKISGSTVMDSVFASSTIIRSNITNVDGLSSTITDVVFESGNEVAWSDHMAYVGTENFKKYARIEPKPIKVGDVVQYQYLPVGAKFVGAKISQGENFQGPWSLDGTIIEKISNDFNGHAARYLSCLHKSNVGAEIGYNKTMKVVVLELPQLAPAATTPKIEVREIAKDVITPTPPPQTAAVELEKQPAEEGIIGTKGTVGLVLASLLVSGVAAKIKAGRRISAQKAEKTVKEEQVEEVG